MPQNVMDARADFNGDGKDDILWRNDAGYVGVWFGRDDGGFTSGSNWTLIGTNWRIDAVGDFDGNGRDDILWQNNSKLQIIWFGQTDGSFFTDPNKNSVAPFSASFRAVGNGDFNGDGFTDILWRDQDGFLTQAVAWGNGQHFTLKDPTTGSMSGRAGGVVPLDWHIVGTGRFNGDNRDDILWRSDSGGFGAWFGNANSSFTNGGSWYDVDSSWEFCGTGDFNADGRDDVIWLHTSGAFTQWLGQGDGSFVSNHDNAAGFASAGWRVAGIGDFNGDNRDDVSWRHESGWFAEWLAQPDGSFVNNEIAGALIENSWHAQPIGIFV